MFDDIPFEQVPEPPQVADLRTALDLLHMPVLERKMQGVNILVSKLSSPKPQELLDWCAANQIFQLFFSKFLHAELIKRSFPLLEFLHRHNRLRSQEINQMWHVATKKHEAFRHAVFKALAYLANKTLVKSELHELFTKLHQMQNKDHDRMSLTLVKTVCKALNRDEQSQKVATPELRKRPRSFSQQAHDEDFLQGANSVKKPQSPAEKGQAVASMFGFTESKAEEKLSHQTGNELCTGGQLGIKAFGFEFDEEHQNSMEEQKHQLSNSVMTADYFNNLSPCCVSEANNELAAECLMFMWQLCLDPAEGFQDNLMQRGTSLPLTLHLLCVDQFTETVCFVYPQSWFFFFKRAVDHLKQNRHALTMQLILRKLLQQAQLPLPNEQRLRTAQDLVKYLDQKLQLTIACTNSLVLFKRESLLAMRDLSESAQEDDNLETQSSLSDISSQHSVDQPQLLLIRPVEESKEPQRQQTRSTIITRDFLDHMITCKIYQKSFYQDLCERLQFLKSLIGLNPFELLSSHTFQLLWQILVQNAFYEKERDLFFTFASESLLQVQQKQNQRLMESGYQEDVFNDDCLEQVFFETLLKLEFKSFTLQMITCFWDFLLHINASYGQVELLGMGEFKAHTYRLIGVEALFEICFSAQCEQAQAKAQQLLVRLLGKCEVNKDLKMFVLQTCEMQIRQGLSEPCKGKIAKCVAFLHRFISHIEQPLSSKAQVNTQEIRVEVTNSVTGTQGPLKLDFVFNTMTRVSEIFQACSLKVFPQKRVEELTLLLKGSFLQQPQKTLGEITKETHVKMVLGSKSEFELEYEQMQSLGQTDPKQLDEAVQNLKEFLGGSEIPEKVIGLALQKCNLDFSEAMLMITDPDQIASLEAQLEEETMVKKLVMPVEVEEPSDVNLSSILSNQSSYFDLLFDLLQLKEPEVTEATWSLLNQLPVNTAVLQRIKHFEGIVQISDSEFEGWDQIVDNSQTYRMLYSLQLINSMVSVSAEDLTDQEVHERVAWRLKFLELGGFNHLYHLLITSVQELQSASEVQPSSSKKPKKSKRLKNAKSPRNQEQQDHARCLSLLISLLQVFLSAALLSFDQNRHLQPLIQTSSTSPFCKSKKRQLTLNEVPSALQMLAGGDQSSDNLSSNDKSSQNTPQFNRSFSNLEDKILPQPQTDAAPKPKRNQLQQTQIDDYPRLIQQMKDAFAPRILFQTTNFIEFTIKMCQIASTSLLDSWSDSEADSLVQRCLDTLLPVLVWDPKLIQHASSLEEILTHGLSSPSQPVRECVLRFFRICCQHNLQGISELVTHTLYQRLTNSENHLESFQLLSAANYTAPSDLFVTSGAQKGEFFTSAADGKFNVPSILHYLLSQLSHQNETQTQGFLTLTQSLLDLHPGLKPHLIQEHNLTDFLLSRMFVELQSKPVRKKCMDLLKTLAFNCQAAFEPIIQKLDDFLRQIEIVLQKRDVQEYFQTQGQVKSATGYVGLRNFGSTCYMNALLQQLFMVREFSSGVLGFNEKDESSAVVAELQQIFAHLTVSEKQAFSPLGFTQVFQLERGQQLNVRQQQDTQEFLNVLLDNLENTHKSLKELIKSCLGGTIINELKSLETEYPYQSHREEPFYCLSLDIQGKHSLQEALDFWVKPDVLEGENKYQCDKHNRLIEAQRRQFLKGTQDTLIINLKRFEFDYSQLMHVKINDFCEFPTEIDLYPWTQGGIAGHQDSRSSEQGFQSDISDHQEFDEHSSFDNLMTTGLESKKESEAQEQDFVYTLVGVLVHSGSANSGHYYSYIKERDSQRWLEFNDTHVSEFDVSQLNKKCFGRSKDAQNQFESQANAYLLFYERVTKKPVQKQSKSPLFEEIESENRDLRKMQGFLDWDFFHFLWEFVSQSKPLVKSDTTCHKFGARFATAMLTKLKETGVFVQWTHLLEQLFSESQEASVWFSQYIEPYLSSILLEHTNGEVREAFANLLKVVIRTAAKTEQETITIAKVCSLLGDAVQVHSKRNDEYFEVIRDCLNLQGPRMISIFRDCGFIDTLLQVTGDGKNPVLAQAIDLLSLIVTGCQINAKPDSPKQLYQNFKFQCELPNEIWKQLVTGSFFNEVLTRAVNDCAHQLPEVLDSLCSMLVHLCWDDPETQSKLLSEVTEVVEKVPAENLAFQYMKHFSRKVHAALSLEDSSESSEEEVKKPPTAFDELFM